MNLSLIVAYRNRPEQLQSLLNWFPEAVKRSGGNLELIIVESSLAPSLDRTALPTPIHYQHLEESGPFNKSRLLNIGFALATGEFVTSFDVDLFPHNLSFETHLRLARQSEILLVAGYRLITSFRSFSVEQLSRVQATAKIARENLHEGFLQDQLLNKHRFGVVPFFKREIINSIGGWDEHYVGWGGEDQDIIHRYLANDRFLLTSPDCLYLHLEHGHVTDWNDGELTRKNREYLYQKLGLTPSIP